MILNDNLTLFLDVVVASHPYQHKGFPDIFILVILVKV